MHTVPFGFNILTQNTSEQSFISVGFVNEALNCGRSSNVDIGALLDDLQISKSNLDRLKSEDFARIWLELSRRMDDEFFGLGKRPLRPGSTTLLGHAVRGAANFEVALRRMIRFLEVCIEDPRGEIAIEGENVCLNLIEAQAPRSAFAYRAFFLIVHGFSCWLVGERIPIKQIQFPCNAPTAENDYDEFFGVPVRFKADAAKLIYDQKVLNRPVLRSESNLKKFLRETPETFVRGYRDVGNLKQRVISECYFGEPVNWPNSEEAAQRLNLSRSSLYRLLKRDGQSLNGIRDELRRNEAIRLLTKSESSVSQISEKLGYAEESAFFRAFKRWYGSTPGKFRETMQPETTTDMSTDGHSH